jgi:hypothetical protein
MLGSHAQLKRMKMKKHAQQKTTKCLNHKKKKKTQVSMNGNGWWYKNVKRTSIVLETIEEEGYGTLERHSVANENNNNHENVEDPFFFCHFGEVVRNWLGGCAQCGMSMIIDNCMIYRERVYT